MTFPNDEARRPLPSTGRQDRHRAEPPPAPAPTPAGDPAVGALPPRGAELYARGHARHLGFGCLVALFLGAAAISLLLLALGLTTRDDFIPAGAAPTAPPAESNAAGEAGAPAAE